MARNSVLTWGSVAALALLAACNPAPPYQEVNDPFAPLPEATPVTTAPLATPGAISEEVITPAEPVITPADGSAAPLAADGTTAPDTSTTSSDTITQVNQGGLVERLPNTCMLENYQQYQGTDGLIAVGLVTDRPARLVAPGDIVSQVYDPQRVNFYTDGNGRVSRISCG